MVFEGFNMILLINGYLAFVLNIIKLVSGLGEGTQLDLWLLPIPVV